MLLPWLQLGQPQQLAELHSHLLPSLDQLQPKLLLLPQLGLVGHQPQLGLCVQKRGTTTRTSQPTQIAWHQNIMKLQQSYPQLLSKAQEEGTKALEKDNRLGLHLKEDQQGLRLGQG